MSTPYTTVSLPANIHFRSYALLKPHWFIPVNIAFITVNWQTLNRAGISFRKNIYIFLISQHYADKIPGPPFTNIMV